MGRFANMVAAARTCESKPHRKVQAFYAAIAARDEGYDAESVTNPFDPIREADLHESFSWMMWVCAKPTAQSRAWAEICGAA